MAKAGLTRLSPGVYRNAKGGLVTNQGRALPRGLMSQAPRQMPKYTKPGVMQSQGQMDAAQPPQPGMQPQNQATQDYLGTTQAKIAGLAPYANPGEYFRQGGKQMLSGTPGFLNQSRNAAQAANQMAQQRFLDQQMRAQQQAANMGQGQPPPQGQPAQAPQQGQPPMQPQWQPHMRAMGGVRY